MWQIAAALTDLFAGVLIHKQKQNFLRRNMTLNNSFQTAAAHLRKEIEEREVPGAMDVFFRSGRVPRKMQR
ncbi:MAG: hypothetical protein LZF63_02475 [Nitrosomonas sp.]|nr:hypothetical protein [Nitrosomonas sp.]